MKNALTWICAAILGAALCSCSGAANQDRTLHGAQQLSNASEPVMHEDAKSMLAAFLERDARASLRAGRIGAARDAAAIVRFFAGDERASIVSAEVDARVARLSALLSQKADDAEAAGERGMALAASEASARLHATTGKDEKR